MAARCVAIFVGFRGGMRDAATYENVNHLCKFRKRESPHGARSIKPGVSPRVTRVSMLEHDVVTSPLSTNDTRAR